MLHHLHETKSETRVMRLSKISSVYMLFVADIMKSAPSSATILNNLEDLDYWLVS